MNVNRGERTAECALFYEPVPLFCPRQVSNIIEAYTRGKEGL
ncbi:hypothetical protein PthstB1num2_06420 [Parageobacillus thermoglucosidasius]|nr:hypothetical protein B4168_2072 [Anoxybacillus flavithermus]OAO85728.1 hypothetical protein GT23_2631 [Parageobacillus thermoglucosidasius]GMN98602.1 hypothetical protein PthstB1num2_06420 [Parageobacillus thermoglucosidasius]